MKKKIFYMNARDENNHMTFESSFILSKNKSKKKKNER